MGNEEYANEEKEGTREMWFISVMSENEKSPEHIKHLERFTDI